MNWSRRTILGALAALPLAAEAKPRHEKHDKKPKSKSKHDHAGKHDKATSEPTPEVEVTPEPEPTATPEPALTKKQRKKARQQENTQALVTAAVSAPAAVCLVKRYYGAADGGGERGMVDAYFPWQFKNDFLIADEKRTNATYNPAGTRAMWKITDAGAFAGWDVFPFGRANGVGHLSDGGNKWAEYDVQRPVRVGYVWRDAGAKPSWLNANNGWTVAGTVIAKIQDARGWIDTLTVYVKDFAAGRIAIPGPVDGNGTGNKQAPWILFAEQGGATPTMPSGYTPNQRCSDAYHNTFTSGPWPTYHKAIDYGRSHCYFEHEHGGDWRHVVVQDPTGAPRFGEVAAAGGMNTENHHGNKCYPFILNDGKRLLVTHHFGTTGVGRANSCLQQHHNLELKLYDAAGLHRLLEYRIMADFGQSIAVHQGSNGINNGTLNPSICPNRNQELFDAGYTSPGDGSRQVNVTPFGLTDPGYEPWIADLGALVLGFRPGSKVVANTQDAIHICADDGPAGSENEFCNTAVLTQRGTGTMRFLTFDKPNQTTPFGVINPNLGDANGFFFTNATATRVLTSSADPEWAMRVRQFIKPGFNWDLGIGVCPDDCHIGGASVTRWGDPAVRVDGGIPGDAEGSIFAATHRSQNPSSN